MTEYISKVRRAWNTYRHNPQTGVTAHLPVEGVPREAVGRWAVGRHDHGIVLGGDEDSLA